MDRPNDHFGDTEAQDDPPGNDLAAIRAMLEQSQRDIAAGRTVPLQPVLDRLREKAAAIRRNRPSFQNGSARRRNGKNARCR